MKAIKSIDLTKRFNGLTAVDHLNFEVEEGELFGFLGPNGAGKTTTIKMLTCILQPTEGTAKINGYDIVKEPMEVKRVIGYTPEYPVLYESLTAREFLDFVAALHDVPEGKRQSRVDEMLELFDLNTEADNQINTFSKGVKRKLTLAAALIHRPKVVFLDEPTMGLDAKTAHLVKDILRELVDMNRTVFMTTHIMEIAERICERVAIINEGRIVAIGELEELKKKEEMETLEEVFLKLTGTEEEKNIAKYL